HIKAKKEGIKPDLFPAFRPDKAYTVENPQAFGEYMEKLGEVSGLEITHYSDLIEALKRRVDFFHEQGGRLSDHGLEQLYFFEPDVFDIDGLFRKLIQKQALSAQETNYFKFVTLS